LDSVRTWQGKPLSIAKTQHPPSDRRPEAAAFALLLKYSIETRKGRTNIFEFLSDFRPAICSGLFSPSGPSPPVLCQISTIFIRSSGPRLDSFAAKRPHRGFSLLNCSYRNARRPSLSSAIVAACATWLGSVVPLSELAGNYCFELVRQTRFDPDDRDRSRPLH